MEELARKRIQGEVLMIKKERLKAMIRYIRQMESGLLKVERVNICDEIKIKKVTKGSNSCIKILIKLPKEE